MIWRKQFPESTFDFTYNRRELSAYEKRGCENFHRLNLQTDLAVEIIAIETQETVFSGTPGCRVHKATTQARFRLLDILFYNPAALHRSIPSVSGKMSTVSRQDTIEHTF